MAEAFKPGEPVPKEATRALKELLDDATKQLKAAARRKRSEHFHEARKDLKKARSVLRIIRDAIGEEAYRHENSVYRDAGQAVSSIRDAQVLPEALDKLLSTYAHEVSRAGFRRAREFIKARAEKAHVDKDALERATKDLEAARERLDALVFQNGGWKGVSGGIRRVYRTGLKALRTATQVDDDLTVHEWRKQAKYLRYCLETLWGAWKGPLEAVASELHDLSDWLGEDHDLAVLRETLKEDDRLDSQARHALEALVSARQKELREKARELSNRIYAEKPKAFARRLHRYWSASGFPD